MDLINCLKFSFMEKKSWLIIYIIIYVFLEKNIFLSGAFEILALIKI